MTSYNESYPPDKVTYFKGIIGTMDTSLRWDYKKNHIEADLAKGYGDPQFPQKLSEIGEALFQFITRRFIRSGTPHISNVDTSAMGFPKDWKNDPFWSGVSKSN